MNVSKMNASKMNASKKQSPPAPTDTDAAIQGNVTMTPTNNATVEVGTMDGAGDCKTKTSSDSSIESNI